MGLLFLNHFGVIHRDIKGENIMIDYKKRAKIIDFGSVGNIHQQQGNVNKQFSETRKL